MIDLFRNAASKMRPLMGVLRDKDESTKVEGVAATTIGMLPEDFPGKRQGSLIEWADPVVYDQRSYGATNRCGGYVVAELVQWWMRKKFGSNERISPDLPWRVSKYVDGSTGDAPTYPSSLVRAVEIGCILPDSRAARFKHDMDATPTALEMAEARLVRFKMAYRLAPPNQWGMVDPKFMLKQIRAHIGAGVPVGFGLLVKSSYQNLKSDSVWHASDEPDLYGHFLTGLEYDDDRDGGAVLVKGSWGIGHGSRGWSWIGYDAVVRHGFGAIAILDLID